MAPEPSWVLLDACCWINLLATDRMVETLRALPWSLGVADRVVNEVKGLDALTAQGILTRLALVARPEVATFVRLAAELEDGEAATGAAEVRTALQAIETHARFRPRSGVPYAEWWRQAALAPG